MGTATAEVKEREFRREIDMRVPGDGVAKAAGLSGCV
jgi:hypothetical protein